MKRAAALHLAFTPINEIIGGIRKAGPSSQDTLKVASLTLPHLEAELDSTSLMNEQVEAADNSSPLVTSATEDNGETLKKQRRDTQWPSESAILVAVRVRPLNAKEQALMPQVSTNRFNFSADAALAAAGAGIRHGTSRTETYDTLASPAQSGGKSGNLRRVVDVLDDRVLVFDPPDAESISKYKRALLPVQAYRRFKDMRYAFDRVFGEDSQQEEVFENTTRHLIDGVLEGYNATLFAYGATGCGKTHTISGTPYHPGIIFLTMKELYERIEELKDEKTIEISLSYLEVYNETIRDLLVPPPPEGIRPPSLHIREDSSKKVSITGLSEHHPKGMDSVMELILFGNGNRTMSPTEANATSSRSHAVLQINICQRLKTADVSEDFTMATLSLIDLAGSERASATKNRGSRLIEGANINKSLLALGNCINALCENRPKCHIPYRDSKLTRLLKFSLGGNCKTVMIACVSPSSQHYEETHNTLKYANRAKNIKTKVTKNTLNVDRHVSEYVQVIYELRQEIAELKTKLQSQVVSEQMERMQQKQGELNRELEDIVRKMRATFQNARTIESNYAHLQSRLFITSARLSALYRWRAGFDSASQTAKVQHQQLEQDLEMKSSSDETDGPVEEDKLARINKLHSAMSASSSYITMVDQLIQDLNDQTLKLTAQMQEQEDSLKLYAVSIESMEQKGSPMHSGFPYQRLYELEKKCQALESHNKILTSKLELSDRSLSEQFAATEDFMELSARSLVGLRPEIETLDQAGLPTRILDDVYMSAITSFTDMTKRINQSILHRKHSVHGQEIGTGTMEYDWSQDAPQLPFSPVGLNGSKMMSILPEVPQTPVKRRTGSQVLPNISMDTVDTKLALGSSSIFGDHSPIRPQQERILVGSPTRQYTHSNHNGNIGASSSLGRRVSSPRKKMSPFVVQFSPRKKRTRGGLRQPRLTPPPAKRSVNFLLDIVAEDEGRYTTGRLDPSNSIIKPLPFPSLAGLQNDSDSGSGSGSPKKKLNTSAIFGPSASKIGMGGGAKRVVPASTTLGNTGAFGFGGAPKRNIFNSGGSNIPTGSGHFKFSKAEILKGPQRVVPPNNNSNGSAGSASSSSASGSTASSTLSSPLKRRRASLVPESNITNGSLGKKPRHSPPTPPSTTMVPGISAATAARIARRQSAIIPEVQST
ncbi:kinesin-like protein Klp5 [Lunasporangiospora selenospora]|uniref:Kinesin-like protein Klp5 n=1 Tax=Lunasporangiospora selenospora TaxID=979761 RepID=A0A9P6G2C3_9FUNG|nr:kinesin-like protein Klp5 [Lunasporangiospora selenospora]